MTEPTRFSFDEFLAFLKTQWGGLAGLSLLFPASNLLLSALRTEVLSQATQDAVNGRLLTAFATVASLFGLLSATMGVHRLLRDVDETQDGPRAEAVSYAGLNFLLSVVAAIAYVSCYLKIDLQQDTKSPLAILCGVLFVAIFYFMTSAFSLLGLISYVRQKTGPLER